MAKEIVVGREVTIHFDAARCIHSRGCILGYPQVHVPNVQGEWIHPDAASADHVLHRALNCPSGAIRVTRNDGSADTPPVVNTLRIRENGPLALEEELANSEEKAGSRAPLFRCGQSQNKPCCDGSHKAAEFKAP